MSFGEVGEGNMNILFLIVAFFLYVKFSTL
jgi:hypothetical protein